MGVESVISPEIREGSKSNVTNVSIGNVAICAQAHCTPLSILLMVIVT